MVLNFIDEPPKHSPFKKGDVIELKGGIELNESKLLVIGNDETHLHTFIVESKDPEKLGVYYGIFDNPENQASFEIAE